jgi:hypothetical protein
MNKPTLFDMASDLFPHSYFNTTSLTGDELSRKELKAGTQNALILDCFKENPNALFNPFDVKFMCVDLWDTPITSIRRAITTLTKLGYLEKTDIRRKGDYGDDNFCWKLAK